MTVVYPDVSVEFVKSGPWGPYFDATDDVVGNIRAYRGIKSNKHTDRTAQIGVMNFSLNNSASNSRGTREYYSPNSGHFGLTAGIQCYITFAYDNHEVYKFFGRVKDVTIDAGIYGRRRVRVTVWDYFGMLANTELSLLGVETNKTIDEAVPLIIANLALQEGYNPENTQYYSGQETFPSVFDSGASGTRGLSEINKLVMSEWGYCYDTYDETFGNTFTVEGHYTRASMVDTEFRIDTGNADSLTTEQGSLLTTESSAYIKIDETQTVAWGGSDIQQLDVSHGKNMLNAVVVSVYPRETDSTNVVLYQSQKAIALSPDQSITVRGSYRDPDENASRVAATDLVTPVATTDYLFNTAEDGTGTDITSDISITSTFGANEFSYSIENTGDLNGYLTKLEVRGKGIYFYEPIQIDNGSLGMGTITGRTYVIVPRYLRIDLPYQDDPVFGGGLADNLREREDLGRNTVQRLSFNPNRSAELMNAFLFLEPGDRISLSEPMTQINDNYFIQGIQFDVSGAGIINATWYLKESATEEYWVLGESALGENTTLGL